MTPTIVTDTIVGAGGCSVAQWATFVTAVFGGIAALAAAVGVNQWLTLRLIRSEARTQGPPSSE